LTNELIEFIQVFGQRYIGLTDNIGVYSTYRVPRPEAPYPQDYIIDQQGIIRYWSDEYDPQKIIKIIDRLLVTSVEQNPPEVAQRGTELRIYPNPARNAVTIQAAGLAKDGFSVRIYDSSGRMVQDNHFVDDGKMPLRLKLPAGVYFVCIESAGVLTRTSMIVVK
jgi:hypothetical protein